MTKENLVRLYKHFKEVGNEDRANQVADKLRTGYNIEVEEPKEETKSKSKK